MVWILDFFLKKNKKFSPTSSAQDLVVRHWTALIGRASEAAAVVDELQEKDVISEDKHGAVRSLNATWDQMREIV